jgi:hypothetical protein
MSDQVVYLNVPKRAPAAFTAEARPAVIVGRKYQITDDKLPAGLHGICGGLDYCASHGRILPLPTTPVSSDCYLWDVEAELASANFSVLSPKAEAIAISPNTDVITGRFVLSHAALSEPLIEHQETQPQLATTASFDFVFSANSLPVRLGLLTLVQTHCFALLKDGQQHTLLDSGEDQSVLFIPDPENTHEVLSTVLDTATGAEAIQHQHEVTLTHLIPQQLNGTQVESMTVLEQYTSFFMQRELPFSQENIWTPVCAPISWGWSMRVTQRQDGDWCIRRQKLLMPSVGHNGLELPEWEGNHLGL